MSDYALLETHESKYPFPSIRSDYTYNILFIFDSKEKGERFLSENKDKYKWRGNSTGSIDYDLIPREEAEKIVGEKR